MLRVLWEKDFKASPSTYLFTATNEENIAEENNSKLKFYGSFVEKSRVANS